MTHVLDPVKTLDKSIMGSGLRVSVVDLIIFASLRAKSLTLEEGEKDNE